MKVCTNCKEHKIPLSSGKTYDDFVKLSHYSNLQLLLAKDNMEKSDRLDWVRAKL